MTEAHPNPFVNHIRHLIGSVSAAALTDGQLLERFLAHRDETAVEVLVRRHGPLVFGVCRRVLHNAQAAEDVFQATFLVLLRKASSLDRARPLGNWLYTVAYRLALRARANEIRRLRCEEQAARRRPSTDGPAANPSDLVVALEEELHRLPRRHRAALVLCYLEGKTNDQAAEILGCPRGSLAARLAQGRERLRECLARRGFVAPAAGIATALTTAATQAAVSLPLLDTTVRAALWFAREEASALGSVSTQAVALARGAFRTMFLNKVKLAGVLLLAVALLGTGATMLLKAASQNGPLAQAVDQKPPEARAKPAEVPAAVPDLGVNAALKYGQAFVTLPKFTDAEGEKLNTDYLTMPLDAKARELVTRSEYALQMLHRGAALPRCDWGIGTEEGIYVRLPHGPAARMLASLACLRARLRFEEGRKAEATDDVVAALTLARHASLAGTNIMVLVGYAIEHRASATLAIYLPGLNARMIKDLKTRLDALPPGMSVAAALGTEEKFYLDWFVRTVKESKDKAALLAHLSILIRASGPEGKGGDAAERDRQAAADARAFLKAAGGTAEGLLKVAEKTRSSYGLVARKLDLPLDQFEKEFEREKTRQADNPVFKMFFPAMVNVRRAQARAEVRRALLSAALAVQLDGRDALKKHPDPVVGGPFEYVAFEGGFELRSRLKQTDDKPVALTVGRRGK